jgi:lipid II:glycine glycyltransferase (peptidoglycan interpeptide bridge formation enzyme)
MKPKTRYNIGLARKKGVRAGLCSASKLPLFYDLYCQTARRNGFEISNYRSFETLFSTSGYDRDKAEIVLLMATHGSDPLAAAIVAISEKGALFLHGASGNIKRNYMGSYALHWEAIQYAQARGCNVYDMGAVSPGPDPDDYFYGLFRFKSGFGGRIVHKIGTWDYPVKNDIYLAFRNWEASVTGS